MTDVPIRRLGMMAAHDRLRAPLLGRDDVDCQITRDTLTQVTLANVVGASTTRC
ncbi:MAG: hypothetical protein M3332_07465 [Actinomycetota bacterium]|nr:hypothetical protein [Actinomycetota bacterium]